MKRDPPHCCNQKQIRRQRDASTEGVGGERLTQPQRACQCRGGRAWRGTRRSARPLSRAGHRWGRSGAHPWLGSSCTSQARGVPAAPALCARSSRPIQPARRGKGTVSIDRQPAAVEAGEVSRGTSETLVWMGERRENTPIPATPRRSTCRCTRPPLRLSSSPL